MSVSTEPSPTATSVRTCPYRETFDKFTNKLSEITSINGAAFRALTCFATVYVAVSALTLPTAVVAGVVGLASAYVVKQRISPLLETGKEISNLDLVHHVGVLAISFAIPCSASFTLPATVFYFGNLLGRRVL